jgi:hypothetical protein
MIDHDAAEKLRTMLSDIQQKALSHADADVAPRHSMGLVEYISQVGFQLVDEMEGVMR